MLSKIKNVHLTCSIGAAVLVGGLTAYALITRSEQFKPRTQWVQEIRALPPNGASRNGTAEYRARVATAKSRIDEHHPLTAYKPMPGIDGRNALDEIYFKGVPATPQSVDAIKVLLNGGQLNADEKFPAIRILASLHNQENSSERNSDIEFELIKITSDSNKQVAVEAAISLARLGYTSGAVPVLRGLFASGALGADEYFGEMAHLISSAPLEVKMELMAEIRKSSNQFAAEILAASLNSDPDGDGASFLKSSEDMAILLRATEIRFPLAVRQFGLGDAIRYTEWIRASAAIESQKTGGNIDDFVIAKLSEPGTDPRKLMGYLASPEAMPLLAAAPPDSAVQTLVTLAERHANQNPSNPNMGLLVQQIRGHMTNPPAAVAKPVFTPPTAPVMPPTATPGAPQTMPRYP